MYNVFLKNKIKVVFDENKIEYLSLSTLDPLGRVFKYKEGIYRGIYSDKKKYVEVLLGNGLIKELVRKKLVVETEKINITTRIFPLILKHKKILASYPTEWTFDMLKDAAKVIIEVNKICKKHGYQLRDAHPYNIMFDGSRPKWIDIGSIVPSTEGWPALDEFVDYTLLPLTFLQFGHLYEAYAVLQSEKNFKISSKNFKESLIYKNFKKLVKSNLDYYRDYSLLDSKLIDNYFENKDDSMTQWSDYQGEYKDMLKNSFKFKGNKFNRFFDVIKLIKKYSPDVNSLLDLAGSNGLMALIARKSLWKIKNIINLDYDYYSINKSYCFFKKFLPGGVSTFVSNFILPMNDNVYINFKSDVVLAMAITHHLLLTQGFKIDEIFEKIGLFSNKYVYIEFMPLGLWGDGQNNLPSVPDWYTSDFFETNFKKHFKLIEKVVLESHVIKGKNRPHRVMFIGQIKND